jgi:hypothetical protein
MLVSGYWIEKSERFYYKTGRYQRVLVSSLDISLYLSAISPVAYKMPPYEKPEKRRVGFYTQCC